MQVFWFSLDFAEQDPQNAIYPMECWHPGEGASAEHLQKCLCLSVIAHGASKSAGFCSNVVERDPENITYLRNLLHHGQSCSRENSQTLIILRLFVRCCHWGLFSAVLGGTHSNNFRDADLRVHVCLWELDLLKCMTYASPMKKGQVNRNWCVLGQLLTFVKVVSLKTCSHNAWWDCSVRLGKFVPGTTTFKIIIRIRACNPGRHLQECPGVRAGKCPTECFLSAFGHLAHSCKWCCALFCPGRFLDLLQSGTRQVHANMNLVRKHVLRIGYPQ